MQYLVACNHCSQPVLMTAQLAVADWRRLRAHLMTCAENRTAGVPDALGDLLTHFRVQRNADREVIH